MLLYPMLGPKTNCKNGERVDFIRYRIKAENLLEQIGKENILRAFSRRTGVINAINSI